MVSYLRNRYGLVAAFCMLTPSFCVAQQLPADSVSHREPLFLSFQVPDSTAIFPASINDLMVVTGSYSTASGYSRGFVRYADGTITTFTVPGAMYTQPVSINSGGDITGTYEVPWPPRGTTPPQISSVWQGFVRAADGTITTFGNTPNGWGTSDVWVEPLLINVAGEVFGSENHGRGVSAFTRSPSGTIEKFSLGLGSDAYLTGANASGALIGFTSAPQSRVSQGFLWSGNGATPIIAFGSSSSVPLAINAGGTIVGCYSTSYHTLDFVRDVEGTFTTLYIPGVGEALCNVTINDAGTIMGYYPNAANVNVGFIKPHGGELTPFAYPGATDTFPTSLNNLDVVTGWYSNGSTTFGFIFVPGS
jgi:hypothetical protein